MRAILMFHNCEGQSHKTVWPFCFTSTEARLLIRDGDWGGGGGERRKSERKTGETVDRRQNNGSVKAVSPRHCPATSALRNRCYCRAGQSHKDKCPLHWCWGTTRSERSPTFAAQLHLPAHDLFWANLRVQLHLPPLDLAWNPVQDSVHRTTTFEEKGEPKQIRTEGLPLTSLSNALPLGQIGSRNYWRSECVIIVLIWFTNRPDSSSHGHCDFSLFWWVTTRQLNVLRCQLTY